MCSSTVDDGWCQFQRSYQIGIELFVVSGEQVMADTITCENIYDVNHTNDIIHDTHYSSLRVMMSAVCGLIRWKQSVSFSMCSEPRRNNPFNEFRDKT